GGLVLVSWEDAGAGVRYTVERNPPLPGGSVSVEGRRSFLDACGEGVYSYRVQRREGVQDRRGPQSAWVRVVVVSRREVGQRAGEILRGVTIGGDGWAELAPTVDSRSVYVSSSGGDDRNDGLSPESPKRTIRAGYGLLRDGPPDWLLLRSGDTWGAGERGVG